MFPIGKRRYPSDFSSNERKLRSSVCEKPSIMRISSSAWYLSLGNVNLFELMPLVHPLPRRFFFLLMRLCLSSDTIFTYVWLNDFDSKRVLDAYPVFQFCSIDCVNSATWVGGHFWKIQATSTRKLVLLACQLWYCGNSCKNQLRLMLHVGCFGVICFFGFLWGFSGAIWSRLLQRGLVQCWAVFLC